MRARLKNGLLAAAVLVAGTASLYAFHRARSPHRTEPREGPSRPAEVLRVGYFPAVTHAVPLLGFADGDFARAAGPAVHVERIEFSAGPSAVEALFAGSIDMAYVGPNPALNAYLRSRGRIRVVAGAASGGAALVVREGIGGVRDIRRLATPQLGNTQDVSARAWLRKHEGAAVDIVPLRPPDQLTTFLKGDIDAAWTVEPWVSRLVAEGGGRVLVDERDLWPDGRFPTTLLVVDRRFLEANPEIVRRWLSAHADVVRRLRSEPDARGRVNAELGRLVGKPLAPAVLEGAFGRMEFTWDPMLEALKRSARQAYDLGYLGKEAPELADLFDPEPLREALRSR